jgi:hypothetical protein
MIEKIIQQIDENYELRHCFSCMASHTAYEQNKEQALATEIKAWFSRRQNEDIDVKLTYELDSYLDAGLLDLFRCILQETVANITDEQWLTIARHQLDELAKYEAMLNGDVPRFS